MKRRLLSMILVFALCITLLPMQAMAEDAGGNEETGDDAKTYTVSFDLQGYGNKSQTPAKQKVAPGGKIQEPSYPQVDQADGLYYFDHWETKDSHRWDFSSDKVTSDMTLYAIWWKYCEAHELVSMDGQPYTGTVEFRDSSGQPVYNFEAKETSGNYTDYVCDGVKPGIYQLYIGGENVNDHVIVNRGAPYLNEQAILYHVTFDANGQVFTDDTKPDDVLCYNARPMKKDKVSKPQDPQAKDSSYVFAGWTNGPGADSGEFDFSRNIGSKTTIYAQWEKLEDADSVLVTVERSTIKNGSRTVKKGQDYKATLVPNEGFELPYHAVMSSYKSYTYVTIDGQVLDASKYAFNCNTGEITIPGEYVTGNILIHTVPRKLPYTVSFTNNGGTGRQESILVYGTNNGYDYEKDYGMTYWIPVMPECTITPPDGKVFDQWSNGSQPGDKGNASHMNLRITGDTEIYPVWRDASEGEYTVAYDLTGCSFTGKTSTTAGADYTTTLKLKGDYTNPITIASVTADGTALDSSEYTFDNDTGVLTIPSAKITGNIIITASAVKGYHVNLQKEGNGTVTASPELAAEGETVKLTASPDDGYEFTGWQVVSPAGLIIDENGSFTMPGEDVTVKAVFEPVVYSGTCGQDMTWTLDASTGELIISGTGAMTSNPWKSHRTLIRTVKISDGVTSLYYDKSNVSNGVFSFCENITSIELPASLTRIEADEFRSCTKLTSITIPDGVTYIGARAFLNCPSMKTLTLPGSVTSIGDSAFDKCSQLTDINFYGTQEQWDGMTRKNSNDPLNRAALHILHHSIQYDANGGEGAPAKQIKVTDEDLTLSTDVPVREGYTFLGWATSAVADAAQYQPGDPFQTDEDTTLYAVWKEGIYQIAAAPENLSFESRLEDYTELPEAQAVTITNDGNREITLNQPAAEHYEIGALSQTTLQPSETATFTVQPKSGLATGNYKETIHISGSDGTSAAVEADFVVKEASIDPPGQPDQPGKDPENPGGGDNPGEKPGDNPEVNPSSPAGDNTSTVETKPSLTAASTSKAQLNAAVQTGDNSSMALWISLMLMGMLGAAGTALCRRRKMNR